MTQVLSQPLTQVLSETDADGHLKTFSELLQQQEQTACPSSGPSARTRTQRLLQQQAIIQFGQNYVIDCSKLAFSDLLISSYQVSPVFAQCVERAIKENQHIIQTRIRESGIASKSEYLKLVAASDMLSDIRKCIKPLSDIGAEIKRLREMQGSVQLPNLSEIAEVQTWYVPNRQIKAIPYYQQLFSHQVYNSIAPTETPSADFISDDLFLEALENCAQGRFSPLLSPKFIGFVPSIFANEWAKPHSFRESNWSLNFPHGEPSHILQPIIAQINSANIEFIVDKGLWYDFFDMNHYGTISKTSLVENNSNIDVIAVEMRLFANSPAAMQENLSTGAFSSALQSLLTHPQFNDFLPELSESLGIPDLTKNKLKEIIDNILILELAIASQTAKAQCEIQTVFPNINLHALNHDILMNFGLEQSQQHAAIRHKALQHFQNKDVVFGYYQVPKYDAKTNCMIQEPKYMPIKNEADIQKCTSFVVLPKDSPRLKDLPQHVLDSQ
ncbi:MAG: hypothetical protein ACPGUD_08170 [Parashewanella sp.]